MEPRIQYARTADGLNIAYAVSGSGPVLVSIPSPPDNHIQLEWEQTEQRESIEAISRFRAFVRFDGRGTGLSDRVVGRYTLDDRVRDMEAVVDRLGVDRFDAISGGHGCQVMAAYAARHPERVGRLVAVDPFVHGEEFISPDQMSLMRTILERDFGLFTENVGALVYGWGREEGPRYSANYRQCVTQADAIAIYDALIRVDLSDILPRVTSPVLVVHRSGFTLVKVDSVRRFAGMLPDAQFAVLPERAVEGASGGLRRLAGTFFGEDWSAVEPGLGPAAGATGLRIILFTDLEGHGAMMTRLGDAKGREVLREHERITRQALANHGGAEVKSLGDGFLATFGSAQRALECAAALQRAMHANDGEQLRVRVGVNAGEPIAEDDDLFGASVITAARIAEKAEGGQVLVADVVRQLVTGKGFLFGHTGEHVLKGMEEPVQIWELRWEDNGR